MAVKGPVDLTKTVFFEKLDKSLTPEQREKVREILEAAKAKEFLAKVSEGKLPASHADLAEQATKGDKVYINTVKPTVKNHADVEPYVVSTEAVPKIKPKEFDPNAPIPTGNEMNGEKDLSTMYQNIYKIPIRNDKKDLPDNNPKIPFQHDIDDMKRAARDKVNSRLNEITPKSPREYPFGDTKPPKPKDEE